MSSTEAKVYWSCTRDQQTYLHSKLVFIRYNYRISGISLLSILLTVVMNFHLTICIINHIATTIIIITIIRIKITITDTNHVSIIITIITTTTTTTTSITIITVITVNISVIIIIILACRCRLFSTNVLSELLLDHIQLQPLEPISVQFVTK